MVEIEINSRFDTSDFQPEVISKLSESGYIEYVKSERTPTKYIIGGWRIKKPFVICIKDV